MNAPPSRLHSNRLSASVEVKVNEAASVFARLAGCAVMRVSGAVASTVQLHVAGVASVFPAASVARAALYFVVWSAIALWYRRLSRRQDTDRDPALTQRLRRYSGALLVPLAVTHTFAAFGFGIALMAFAVAPTFIVGVVLGVALGAAEIGFLTLNQALAMRFSDSVIW